MSERGETGESAGVTPESGPGSSQVTSPEQDTAVAPLSLTGTLGVLAPVVIALAISVFFVTLFLLAFRSPTPHHLRVGITGPASASGALRQAVAARAPGAFDLRDYPDPGAAQAAVEHRDVYSALVIGPDQWTLLVAGANGSALTPALRRSFEPVAAAARARLTVVTSCHGHRETRPGWRSSTPRSVWSWEASSSASTPTRSLPA